MYGLAKYTTPDFDFYPEIFQVSELQEAILCFKIRDESVIEKTLAEATVDAINNRLTWTLAQTDTADLIINDTGVYLVDWMLQNGLRYQSTTEQFRVLPAGHNGVLGV